MNHHLQKEASKDVKRGQLSDASDSTPHPFNSSELNQGEKIHRVLEHSNTHSKPKNSSLENSLFSFIIFHQFLNPFSSVRPLMAMRD